MLLSFQSNLLVVIIKKGETVTPMILMM